MNERPYFQDFDDETLEREYEEAWYFQNDALAMQIQAEMIERGIF